MGLRLGPGGRTEYTACRATPRAELQEAYTGLRVHRLQSYTACGATRGLHRLQSYLGSGVDRLQSNFPPSAPTRCMGLTPEQKEERRERQKRKAQGDVQAYVLCREHAILQLQLGGGTGRRASGREYFRCIPGLGLPAGDEGTAPSA